MIKTKVKPEILKGKVHIPPSKSLAHRAVICSALCEDVSYLYNIDLSQDIIATIEAVKSLGAVIDIEEDPDCGRNKLKVKGIKFPKIINENINCNESGSTLRFMIPLAALTNEKVLLHGKGKLVERPLDVYYEIFEEQNIYYKNNDNKLPLEINGQLKSGIFEVKGNISSQFISGLMFALPLLEGDSKIIITTELESKGYVDLTIDILKKFGISIENVGYKEFIIKGSQTYKACDYFVEGDYSQAAFWLCAGALGDIIECIGLNKESLQGDREIVDILNRMGCNLIEKENETISVNCSHNGVTIDARQCPDLVPILSVMGALGKGVTTIVNAERLRIKECDRLKAMYTELKKLGADIHETEDGLIINGIEELKGGIVQGWNDHRIVMSLAVASIKCKGEIVIEGSEAINKSYPKFWDDFKKVGGNINELHME